MNTAELLAAEFDETAHFNLIQKERNCKVIFIVLTSLQCSKTTCSIIKTKVFVAN
jgi:hypothetical protein